jgi:tRNA-uridine 2-sulfurtransferase
MSGGVDSASTALILQQTGYEPVGATLVLHAFGKCGENVADAKRTAERIGIELYAVHGEELFSREVITPFAQSYARGETPNPCVLCNPRVKFALLCKKADEVGARYVATGHYARVAADGQGGRFYLRRALDESKDQTYALWALPQSVLSRLVLPMGERYKHDTRELALEHELVPRGLAESQDICFIPDGDYAAFLTREVGIDSPGGDFVNTLGEVLGRHRGIIHYTIGQRRGLGISAEHRLFVVRKDAVNNRVVLGAPQDLMSDRMHVTGINWMAINPPGEEITAEVRARYHQAAQKARIIPTAENECIVEFETPQRALTPGQSAVFYDGDAMLGGGFIAGEEEHA